MELKKEKKGKLRQNDKTSCEKKISLIVNHCRVRQTQRQLINIAQGEKRERRKSGTN